MTLAVVAAGTLLSRSSSCGYIDRTAVVESENYRNSESGYNKSSLNVIFDPINNLLHRSFLSPTITNLAQNLTAQCCFCQYVYGCSCSSTRPPSDRSAILDSNAAAICSATTLRHASHTSLYAICARW